MANEINHRKRFHASLIGICLIISLLPVTNLQAGEPDLAQPIYLSPDKVPAPVLLQPQSAPVILAPSSVPKPRRINKLPADLKAPAQPQSMGMLTGAPGTGKTVFVYDGLNRLIRAIYDQNTVAYSYDSVGNRITRRVTLTKPVGTVDFDGDAKNDIAIYRVSTGEWFIIPSSTGVAYGVGWGGDPSDKPAPGDYDGDGMTDIAVYRVSTGAWYILPSGGDPPIGVGWGGNPSDIPVSTNPASLY